MEAIAHMANGWKERKTSTVSSWPPMDNNILAPTSEDDAHHLQLQAANPQTHLSDVDHERIVQENKAKKQEEQRKKLLHDVAKAKKRGVCYLSRIPPHLKPLKLRHFLSQYGEVLRIFLAPEDAAVRLRRKIAGKKTGKNFTEGWVEFASKSTAKKIAKMLNGEPMGGKRRSAYYYDLWNIKYLKGFKWDNLTEENAYKNAIREQKLAADISAAKRERDFYLAKVDQSKAIRAMEDRKNKRQKNDVSHSSMPESQETGVADPTRIVRYFSQKKSVPGSGSGNAPRLSTDILTAVFGSNHA